MHDVDGVPVKRRTFREWAESWEVARWGRLLAGISTLIFTVLGVWVHAAWLLGTAGVAMQLVLSALTDHCPMRDALLRMGLHEREYLFDPTGKRRNPL